MIGLIISNSQVGWGANPNKNGPIKIGTKND